MKTDKKRARPRITETPRKPNERISRAKNLRKPSSQLTIEMRAKHFGLSIEDAKNPLSGSYIGRLCLLGYKQDASGISKEQYDAAQRYLQIRNDYLCSKGLPHGYYDNFTYKTSNEKAHKKWIEKTTKHYENMKAAIQEAQQKHRQHNFHAALQYLVVEDQALPSLIGSLRLILSILHKHFSC
ncbi:hypothetical protein [Bartonella raoultii]|uniref:Uncharacterized protein n=1 Tax=Bartonella raoultii TaxID=1457020 RepID=A0ABS7I6H5_9HYPH|nr:hypothetical protein [Bartonella raoultii]MBX4336494.1 hypothetical protein [Bartonella raoultii]